MDFFEKYRSKIKTIIQGVIVAIYAIHVLFYFCLVPSAASADVKYFLALLFFVLATLTWAGFPASRLLPHRFRSYLEVPSFLWMGVGYPLFLVCLVFFPVHIAAYFYAPAVVQNMLHALNFLLAAVLVVYCFLQAAKPETIINCAVPVVKVLHPDLENFRAVVLSDIHVSSLVRRKRMERLVQRVNALAPDVIWVTGDLVDGDVVERGSDLLPLKDLKAKYGVHYITGNHEYYHGSDPWKQFIEQKLGWDVLGNGYRKLAIGDGILHLMGIEDRQWNNLYKDISQNEMRVQLAAARASLDAVKKELCVVLAHQPKDIEHLRRFPWVDLQVSGHTHGGQLWPLHWFVIKDQRYNRGLYKSHVFPESQSIYVNQGTSFWGPPIRLGTCCEITVLSFKGKAASVVS